MGAAAFDRGEPSSRVPYDDPKMAHYWRVGWRVRRAANARWTRQADQMQATIAKAAPFIDRDWTKASGKARPSDLIALHFFVMGSREPDRAYEWFVREINKHRRDYLDQRESARMGDATAA